MIINCVWIVKRVKYNEAYLLFIVNRKQIMFK